MTAVAHRSAVRRGTPSSSDLLDLQRSAGNGAVVRLVQRLRDRGGEDAGGGPSDGPASNGNRPVQRAIFIKGEYVAPDRSLLREGMPDQALRWAEDDVVRSYVDVRELADHLAGRTDYIGNLPPETGEYAGVWVRFSRERMNVLGERHNLVPLPRVLAAVGSQSFVYESYSAENLDHLPNFKESEEKAYGKHLDEVRGNSFDLALPKLGRVLWGLARKLDEENAREMSGQAPIFGFLSSKDIDVKYEDELSYTMLRSAWALVRDVNAEVGRREDDSSPASARDLLVGLQDEKRALVETYRHASPRLTLVLDGPPRGGRMGAMIYWNCQNRDERIDFREQIAKFCRESVAVLASLLDSDQIVRTVAPRENIIEYFDEHRERAMVRRLREAQSENVRYAGMGALHLENLARAGNLPRGVRVYRMDNWDLREFKANTNRLRAVLAAARAADRP